MRPKQGSIEQSLEGLEPEIELIEGRGDKLEQRAERLGEAIAKLEADAAVAKSLEITESNLEAQIEDNDRERQNALSNLDTMLTALEALEETNSSNDAALDSLRELGVDVTEAESIIGDRQRWIEESRLRIEHLYEMLGEDFEWKGGPSSDGKSSLGKSAEQTIENPDQQGLESDATQTAHGFSEQSGSGGDPVATYNDYMTSHNWRKEDFPVYSKTLEWRRLVHAAYPNYRRPSLNQATARRLLSEYMNGHNYGRSDYAIYSKDPEWQYLTLTSYPETMAIGRTWAKEVNPNYENMALPYEKRKLYCRNCGSCAFVLEQHFNGVAPEQKASSVNIDTDQGMEQATGLTCKYMHPGSIKELLIARGPGSHLIVGINRKPVRVVRDGKEILLPQLGHWFNAYYDGKQVYTVDGQTGHIYDWPHDYGDVSEWCALV